MICIARHSKSLKGRKERKNDEPIRSRENKKIIWGIRNRIFNSLTPGFSPCKKKKKEKKKKNMFLPGPPFLSVYLLH